MTISRSFGLVATVGTLLGLIGFDTLSAHEVRFVVSAGEVDRENSPVAIPLELPTKLAEKSQTVVQLPGGVKIPGQITKPSLLAAEGGAQANKEGLASVQLNFILPKLAAGKTLEASAVIESPLSQNQEIFSWQNTAGDHNDLLFGNRPVLRYMYPTLDESSSDARSATMKVYHHVFDPSGERLVTKGPGGKFPHHRGLFFGFNKITYLGENGEKKSADTWHCNNGEFQSHEGIVSQEVGPVLGRHVVAVQWHGRDGKVFAEELRELTAYNVPGGSLLEFATLLRSEGGKIELRGDPQHAGFQFRASQEVPDKTAGQTYYLRPDGQGAPGKFRNWPGDKAHANLPWNALSFVLGEDRYTCCYLDRPENPKESRFSERDYGRFGSYFEYDLTVEQPLKLNYRVWLQTGEMTVEQVKRFDDDFVHSPTVETKS